MKAFVDKLNEIARQHSLAADYAKTLELLRALKAGEVTIDQVTLTDNGWNVVASAEPLAPSLKLPEQDAAPATAPE